MALERLTVAASVLEELRAAERATTRGHEFGGALFVRAGTIEAFEKLENLESQPGRFRCRDFPAPPAGRTAVRIHSHPSGTILLSPEDVEAARARGDHVVAVYGHGTGVAVWAVSDEGEVRRIPVTIRWPRSSRPPLRRPGRR